MGKWQVHQTDSNAPELERAAKKLGLTILKVGRPVDWVICAFGLAVLCEVKTEKGRLRPDQIRALKVAGRAGRVLRDTADVIALYRDMRAWGTHDGPLHICTQPGYDVAVHRCLGCHPELVAIAQSGQPRGVKARDGGNGE